MRPLVWFRSDLRVRDNPAVYHASRESTHGLVAIFFLTPAQWTAHDWGEAKVTFVIRNLAMLSRDLDKLGIALLVERVDDFEGIPEKLHQLAKRHLCDGLYFNREYEVNERRRDQKVQESFRSAGVPVNAFADQTLIEPGELVEDYPDILYHILCGRERPGQLPVAVSRSPFLR